MATITLPTAMKTAFREPSLLQWCDEDFVERTLTSMMKTATMFLLLGEGNTLKQLTDEMMSIGVENEQDRLMFKRIFILYIQMAFLPPSTIIKVSPVHIAPIFEMEKITEGNWGAHVLNFIIKGITNFRLKKKKSIDGCLYALMIIYFHFTKNKEKKGEEKAAVPWVSNWNREQLVARIRAEINGHMGIVKMAETKQKLKEMKEKEKKEEKKKTKKRNQVLPLRMIHQRLMLMFPLSLSRKKTQRNLQRNNPKGGQKNGIQKEKADFGGFHFRKQKFSQQEESFFDHPLNCLIFPIQLCLPSSQATLESHVPPFEPSSSTESTPEPQKVDESTPTMPPAPSKMDPAPEATTAALLMMARTASYVPKELPLPSFSLGLLIQAKKKYRCKKVLSKQKLRW
ncbi:uncharacterized protein DS421_20g683900 [Arachis hypogaea]|nr:uncharacterized protein DS421_20g683900 [Arachis hypogaea]